MRNKALIITLLLTILPCGAQDKEDFKPAADSLAVLLKERTGVSSTLALDKLLKRGNKLDLYFKRELSDYPWREADIKWFRRQVEALFPESWAGWNLGGVYCRRTALEELKVRPLGNDGKAVPSPFKVERKPHARLVTRIGEPAYSKGLDGRHIALWQSHGRYFNAREGRWMWQRAQLWRTVEDMYTQSYVLPFLIPMLERSGACVMTPRERDTQTDEAVADNDPSFSARAEHTRRKGSYRESGPWEDAGAGFADKKEFYLLEENPFEMGTARKVPCTPSAAGKARAVWTADFPTRGSYAVYVSYASLPESSSCAHYSVEHLGGRSEFVVDQKMGGGTWIYLGTFEFEGKGTVTLDNGTPKGFRYESSSVVSADAVRFGGGYGKVARGRDEDDPSTWTNSGLPAYAEGALYSERWYGAPETVWTEWESDYVRDYASRGAWVRWLKDDKAVPFDLSLAFHTDAGVTPNDSIVGTLSIYTLMCDGHRSNTDGTDRMACRLLADRVQSQIVRDLREGWNPEWSRRQVWDRSYSESRTTDVPAMLLELLSHQNFGDMKYGLDPAFRFDVCRSVYKGVLKFLGELYSVPYVVQPLPVKAFSAVFGDKGQVVLGWEPTTDPLEPTAVPKTYIVYTRMDGGAFDEGRRVSGTHLEVPVSAGHLYEFMVEAENEGGRSFPSEILAAGIPEGETSGPEVLVVNNFTRVSGPTWFDTPVWAGFDSALDGGVPWGSDISYIGEVYQARRELGWKTDYDPGFGACGSEYAGKKVAGNTFDFVTSHGKALMALGRPFCSQGAEAFEGSDRQWDAVDLICGKQTRTALGNRSFEVYPESLQDALRRHVSGGGNIIVSGANIATDAFDRIFPVEVEDEVREKTGDFVREVLGFSHQSSFGARAGKVLLPDGEASLWHEANPEHYHVERCDALTPVSPYKAEVIAHYPEDWSSAALLFRGEGWRTACFGFPLETLQDPSRMQALLARSLEFFNNK